MARFVLTLLVIGSIIQSELFGQRLNGIDMLFLENQELIRGKSVGLITNHTGLTIDGIPNYRLFQEMEDVNLKAVFSPEHGFYGDVSAGVKIDDQNSDALPTIFSLYGKTRKPTQEMLKDIDVLLYDIQDVGSRFYTYISTMGLAMESAAEAGIPFIVLDRPNPTGGNKVEGPVLDLYYKSFVGMYPIPIRYGLTCGELAQMIKGEGWILFSPELTVVNMFRWKRDSTAKNLVMPPSPNIPDIETAVVYSGMCIVEGTNISEGRGTSEPFRKIGAPWIDGNILAENMNNKNLPAVEFYPEIFTPISIPGKSIHPKYQNQKCGGVLIRVTDYNRYQSVLTGLELLIEIRELYPDKIEIKSSIQRLWGNNDLNEMKKNSIKPDALLKSYETDIDLFNVTSEKYKIYE